MSDLWGLAAVLVERFLQVRRVDEPDDSHVRFFERLGDNARVNPHVTDWFKTLRAIAAEKDKTFGEIISDVLTFLENDLLVLDVEKRRKARAGGVQEMLLAKAKDLEGHARASGVFALQTKEAAQPGTLRNGSTPTPPTLNSSSRITGQSTVKLSYRTKAKLKK